MSSDYAISVIIPVFNRIDPLLRALASVYRQSYSPHEVIVVDDGSEYDLKSLLQRQYPQIRYIQQNHQGVSRARNTGVKCANGNWIAFLDSDDEWLPKKLELQVKSLSQSKLLICHTDEIWIRNGIRVNPHKKHQKFGGDIFERALALCLISPSSVLLEKNFFIKLGGFDEKLKVCEDYDLWLRITSCNTIDYVDKLLINKFGGHKDQLSQKYWGMDRFRIYAMEKLYTNSSLTQHQQILLLKELQNKCLIYAKGALKHGKSSESETYTHKANQYKKDLKVLLAFV